MSIRHEIDRRKAMWNRRTLLAPVRPVAKLDVIRRAVTEHLRANSGDPWASPDICAAFELASEWDMLATFEGVWNQVEVRGGFRCSEVEVPPEVALASGLRAG